MRRNATTTSVEWIATCRSHGYESDTFCLSPAVGLGGDCKDDQEPDYKLCQANQNCLQNDDNEYGCGWMLGQICNEGLDDDDDDCGLDDDQHLECRPYRDAKMCEILMEDLGDECSEEILFAGKT